MIHYYQNIVIVLKSKYNHLKVIKHYKCHNLLIEIVSDILNNF